MQNAQHSKVTAGLWCSECSEAPAAVMKFAKSPRQGAETSVQLALGGDQTSTGGYWVDGKKAESLGRGASPLPFNKELAVEGFLGDTVAHPTWQKRRFLSFHDL